MTKIAFVDLDGVLVKQGTQEFLSTESHQRLLQLAQDYDIYFFSCWAFNDNDIRFLNSLGLPHFYIMPKPLADEYIYIDDKLNTQKSGVSL